MKHQSITSILFIHFQLLLYLKLNKIYSLSCIPLVLRLNSLPTDPALSLSSNYSGLFNFPGRLSWLPYHTGFYLPFLLLVLPVFSYTCTYGSSLTSLKCLIKCYVPEIHPMPSICLFILKSTPYSFWSFSYISLCPAPWCVQPTEGMDKAGRKEAQGTYPLQDVTLITTMSSSRLQLSPASPPTCGPALWTYPA